MTQVKEMTNPELNRKLAELMGFEVKGSEGETEQFAVVFNGWTYGMWEMTEEEAWKDAPDYCNDPAASLGVQTAAIAKNPRAYTYYLAEVRWANSKWDTLTPEEAADLFNASPRERSEAAYQTLRDDTATGEA